MYGKNMKKHYVMIMTLVLILTNIFFIIPSEQVSAGSYDGQDLALAILANSSWLVDSTYSDTDEYGHSQAAVLESLGTMLPTNGSNFALISTGIAGTNIITTNAQEPGDERGTWFEGGSHGYPRDRATLTMTLQVPDYMHYLYYDVQFLSAEYPEYVGTQYNDKLTVTVDSPSKGTTYYTFDVNSGYFLLDSNGIPNTGFDIFARSGYPGGVDWVDTTIRNPGADAGASDLIQIGGAHHPVSPNEQITITFEIKDAGDNLFDSAAYIDNLKFTGFAKTEIIARKVIEDLYGESIDYVECGETYRYRITISNTGAADQENNPGNEFEDILPENITYVTNSAFATSGVINYDAGEKKIYWNGDIHGESSVILSFNFKVNEGLSNGTIISNQGIVNWDSNEDGNNDATELTDDAYVDDGIDQDGDGETDDDDPTIISVLEFECPLSVTETFSDDTAGEKATQSFMDHEWFETSDIRIVGSSFEVAPSYYYQTSKSYKTKIRQSSGTHYWNYTLSELNGDISWWESWFICSDSYEEADLYLDFKNSLGEDIAKIKFEYVNSGEETLMNHYIELYYWEPTGGWKKLNSDFENGYLRKSWYKLRIEKISPNQITYSLDRTGVGTVDNETGSELLSTFSDFSKVEFYSTKNPTLCPMIFWDEHTLGLTSIV